MSDSTFRFGLAAAFERNARQWLDTARRAEALGYDSMLIPDTRFTPSPFPALAAAAAVTSRLRVAPWVLAAPLRTPATAARDTAALDFLSDGRFELGLGTGRTAEDAEALGMPFGSGRERRQMVRDTIAAVRERMAASDRPVPPIMLAGAGPRFFELAAEHADIVALALPPTATVDDLAAKAGELRERAGARFDSIELAVGLSAIGDEAPPWLTERMGLDLDEMRRSGAYGVLGGTPAEMADALRERRERTGVSYYTVPAMFAEQFAPVIEALA